MTGTIVGLAATARTGTIRAEDGSLLAFSGAAVLGDFDTLAVGHRVSFSIERGRAQHTAICVFHEPVSAALPGSRPGRVPDLRYTGFEQAGTIRSYRFDAQTAGEATQHCVTVDTAALRQHRIGVQEAPALCLQKVRADLAQLPHSLMHELAEDDLTAFALSRAAALERKKPRHPFTGRRGAAPPAPLSCRRD